MPARLRSLLRALLGRPGFEDGMDAEVRFHLETLAEDLMRAGVPEAEARRRARLEFGSLQRVKEECRQARGLGWPDALARDARYAVRILRRSPGFTATAVVTLALCIGANTAIFSVVDAVLFRPLPYPDAARLAAVVRHYKGVEGDEAGQDGATWEVIRDHASFVDAAVFGGSSGANFVAHGRAEYLRQQRVSAGFFRVLGVNPMLGREFTPEEDRRGGPAVAVLSWGLWRRIFNGDPGAVGGAITLRGEPYTVVGVMPDRFQTSAPADLWTPLRPSTRGEGAGINYSIVARLRPGVTWAQADAQVEAVGQAIVRQMRLPPEVSQRFRLAPLQRSLTDDVRKPLLILWAAVGLVLLIGCTNIAGLLLARTATRTREIATRMALGGGRGAVVRQLLTESLALALLGGVAGAVVGWAGAPALRLFLRQSLGVWQPFSLDARVLAGTMLIALLTSVLFGLLPALAAGRIDIRAALAEGGARGIAGGPRRWPRRLLVAGEIALGVVLLIGAGLLIRTLVYLRSLQPGFDPRNVIAASVSLQDARYKTAAAVVRLFDESLARLREIPGVESAAVGLSLPYERATNVPFRPLDTAQPAGRWELTDFCYITPEYFRALRIPLLEGRGFDQRDTAASPRVAVVSQAFVRRYLRGRQAIGSRADFGGLAAGVLEIVGVVGDVQQRPGWGEHAPLGTVPITYIPATQIDDKLVQLVHTWASPSWVVRTSGPRSGAQAAIQRAVEPVDPQLPFAAVRTMDGVRSESLAAQRAHAALLAAMAGLALLLAAVGIYGLIASSVAERTREMGIRMALGATVARAIGAVALPGLALALAGVALGCLLARPAAQVLRRLIWGVTPDDPATFAGVALLLTLVAAAASLLPALRIARLNPARTLRDE